VVLWLLIRRIASAERVEAESCACLIAWGYAWKSGGGSHAVEVLVGGRVEDLCDDFVDFGLGLVDGFVDMIRIRELGRTGVAGVGRTVSPVLSLRNDRLRLMLTSATALLDRSRIEEAGISSSIIGVAVVQSALFRVKRALNPPLDCLRSILRSCKDSSSADGRESLSGTLFLSLSVDTSIGGGLARRLRVRVDWRFKKASGRPISTLGFSSPPWLPILKISFAVPTAACVQMLPMWGSIRVYVVLKDIGDSFGRLGDSKQI